MIAKTYFMLALALALSACKPYRIEYHTRPAFYHSASEVQLPDELELADGTRVIYRDSAPSKPKQSAEDEEMAMLQIREESENGRVTLRCVLPEHVIANTMTCIRNEEYELIWAQLLAESTRREYEARSLNPAGGKADFSEFMEIEREPIMETLNRMSYGFFGADVVLEKTGTGVQARFSPRLSEQFKYRTVEMTLEGGLMRLVTIR